MSSLHFTWLSILQLRDVVEVIFEMSRFERVHRNDRRGIYRFDEADDVCRQHVTAGMNIVQAAVGVRQDLLS